MTEQKPEWLADILRDWLKREMSDISEEHMAAGWLIDLEYMIWQAVLQHPEPYTFGWGLIELQRIERIKAVSEYLGEWIAWEHGGDKQPVPLDEWRAMFARYKQDT
jgi:hypothetical protein